MIELTAALAAAMLGVLMDRLGRWIERHKRRQEAIQQDRADQRRAVDDVRARIEREIANETDLGTLVDRL